MSTASSTRRMWYSALVPEATQPQPRRRRRIKPWMLALAVVGGLWLCGLVSFIKADGHFEVVLPRRRTPPADLHNLALWDLGPTVRASSYYGDWQSQHHPAFLVDGQWPSDHVQKWVSADRDRHPWVELLWREPHNLERVVLRHAGVVEAEDLTADHYTLHCLTADGRGPSLEVSSNRDAVAAHDLACARALGVRIEFVPKGGNNSKDLIRIYEVEAWGR